MASIASLYRTTRFMSSSSGILVGFHWVDGLRFSNLLNHFYLVVTIRPFMAASLFMVCCMGLHYNRLLSQRDTRQPTALTTSPFLAWYIPTWTGQIDLVLRQDLLARKDLLHSRRNQMGISDRQFLMHCRRRKPFQDDSAFAVETSSTRANTLVYTADRLGHVQLKIIGG